MAVNVYWIVAPDAIGVEIVSAVTQALLSTLKVAVNPVLTVAVPWLYTSIVITSLESIPQPSFTIIAEIPTSPAGIPVTVTVKGV